MNNCYIASKHFGLGEVLEYYIINIPEYGEKGNYTQGLSISYFTSRELKRFSDMYRDKKPPSFWYDIEQKHGFDYDRNFRLEGHEISRKYQEELDNLPHIVCNSVWEFYEKIGYDRKTKKYLK